MFRERGFANVTMDDIGGAAGVSGPAIYRHFVGKEDVLVGVLIPAAAVAMLSVGDEGGEPMEALEKYFSRLVDSNVAHPGIFSLWYLEWRNLPAGELGRVLTQLRKTIGELARLLRRTRPELSLTEAKTTIAVAMDVAGYSGYPGSDSRLRAPALRERLMKSVMAVLRG
jgi:AcrR family transcriptional regulator